MKHTLTLLTLLLTACLAHAQQIPTEFLGLKMGKTTKAEAKTILEKQGHSTMDAGENMIMSWGKATADGITMDETMIFFSNEGALFSILFVGNCNEWDCNKYCEEKTSPIHKKYGSLADAPYQSIEFISELLGIQKPSYWAKASDDGTSIVFTIISEDKKRVAIGYGYGGVESERQFDPANEVTSVSGCKFGDTKANVSQHLRKRFGFPVKDNDNNMAFSDVEIGGTIYNWADFYFKRNPKTARVEFVSAKFQKRFYTWEEEEAKAMYDHLVSQYGGKYTNLKSDVTDDGMVYSICGSSKQYGAPILIYMTKSLSKGGDMYYYVVVEYFPEAIEDLYDDDI